MRSLSAAALLCVSALAPCACSPSGPAIPAAPAGLALSISFEIATVTWSPTPGALEYDVLSAGFDDFTGELHGFLPVHRQQETSYSQAVPSEGWKLGFSVQALGADGPGAVAAPLILERLDPSLAVREVSVQPLPHGLLVSWSAPAAPEQEILAYLLLGASASGGPYQLVTEVQPDSLSAAEGVGAPLPPLATRYYRVRTLARRYASPLSAEVSGTTPP